MKPTTGSSSRRASKDSARAAKPRKQATPKSYGSPPAEGPNASLCQELPPANRIAEHPSDEPRENLDYIAEAIAAQSASRSATLDRRRLPFVSYVGDVQRSMSSRRDVTLADFVAQEIKDFDHESGEHVAVWRGDQCLAVIRPSAKGGVGVVWLDDPRYHVEQPAGPRVPTPEWTNVVPDPDRFTPAAGNKPRQLAVPRSTGRFRSLELRDNSRVPTEIYEGVGLTVADVASDLDYGDEDGDEGPVTYAVWEGNRLVGGILLQYRRRAAYFDLENPVSSPSAPVRANLPEPAPRSARTRPLLRQTITINPPPDPDDACGEAVPVTLEILLVRERDSHGFAELEEAGWQSRFIAGSEVYTRVIA